MDQALHMIMVPATDLANLRTFYLDQLGWESWGPDMRPDADGGLVIALPRNN